MTLTRWLALIALILSTTSTTLWLIFVCGWTPDYGNVPSWLSASAAAVALAGVGIAVTNSRRDQNLRRDDEANQARLVYPSYNSIHPEGGPTYDAPPLVQISVANNSERPIFDVIIESAVVYPSTETESARRVFGITSQQLHGRHTEATHMTPMILSIVERHKDYQHVAAGTTAPVTVWTCAWPTVRDGERHAEFTAKFQFTDAHGRRWDRIGRYSPTRIGTAHDAAPNDLRLAFEKE